MPFYKVAMAKRSSIFHRRANNQTCDDRSNKKLLSRGHCLKLRERGGACYSGKAPYCFIDHFHDTGLCSTCREIDVDRPHLGTSEKCRLRLEKTQIHLCQVELGVAVGKGGQLREGVARNWMHLHWMASIACLRPYESWFSLKKVQGWFESIIIIASHLAPFCCYLYGLWTFSRGMLMMMMIDRCFYPKIRMHIHSKTMPRTIATV